MLNKTLPDNLIANKVDYNISRASQNLSLIKLIEQVQFQQENKSDIDQNISANGKQENINDTLQGELQTTNSARLQEAIKKEEVKKDILNKIDHYMHQTLITQQSAHDASLSQKNIKKIRHVNEFGRYKEEFNAEATQQQMTTNIETPNVEMSNMKKNEDKENELMKQIAYRSLLLTKNHEEIKKIRLQKMLLEIILCNKYNMSDEKLEVLPTDFEQYKTNKFLELQNKILKLELGNQRYMKMIDELCCNEEDIRVKQKDENKNSKKRKIKHEEDEPDMHIILFKKIMELYTGIEWWQQRFQESQQELMTMIIERQKTESELMKLIMKITKLQNLCNLYEKEKKNVLLLLKDKNNNKSRTRSFNGSTLQKSIFQEESQQISSEINNILTMHTLKEQIPEKQIPKDSDKDYIALPSVIWRQNMMKKEDYNRIALPTTNITNTGIDKAMELLKQIKKDSLIKTLKGFEDEINELNTRTVKEMEFLNLKTNSESTVVKEQVIPTFTEELNKSNKADESPEQVNKDALTDSEEKINKTLNKEITATKSLENMEMNDESIVIEKIRDKDIITNDKTENERNDAISTKNVTFSLPCYESLRSNTTKDQSIMKNIMDKAYQRQPPNDYHSCEYSYLYEKSNDACTSQEKDKNQLDNNDANSHICNNVTCTYCTLAEDIRKIKYRTNDYVNNKCQTTANNKNKEYIELNRYTLNEINEEDQAIKIVEENETKEIKNMDLDTINNEILFYAKDVISKHDDEMVDEILMEDISNITHDIDNFDTKNGFQKNWWTKYVENLLL